MHFESGSKEGSQRSIPWSTATYSRSVSAKPRSVLNFLTGIFVLCFFLVALGQGCSSDGAAKHYILAEKLWNEGNYAASVTEFDRASALDPRGKLGLQALYRSAMTQYLFLSHFGDAAKKLKTYADAVSGTPGAWEALRSIGEIYYSKTDQYDRAISHYENMIQLQPTSPEVPEFRFRIAKSRFFLWQFKDALHDYRELIKKFPRSEWAEKAAYEIGVTYYTQGEQHPEGESATEAYQEAMDAYESFLKRHSSSPLVAEARFGIASCLEELDQLDAAYHAYEELLATYPDRNVILIKLTRIKERKAQRSR